MRIEAGNRPWTWTVTLGRLDRTELRLDVSLRFHGIEAFCVLHAGLSRFRWWKLFSPVAWWLAVMGKPGSLHYSGLVTLHSARWHHVNHRCWCSRGSAWDGYVRLWGAGVQWWHSCYNGPVPCVCDRIIEDLHAGKFD